MIVTSFLPVTDDAGGHTTYQLVNDGKLPALAVEVHGWTWGARRRLTWRLRPVTAWMTGRRIPGGVFPQLEAQSRTDDQDIHPLHIEGSSRAGERPPIMLVFRDGHGRLWVRWPDGRLNSLALSRDALRHR